MLIRRGELLDLQPGLLCVEIPGVTGVALRNRDETTVAFLQAPFQSIGGQSGVGVGWRPSSREDEAWFLDASTLEVRRERKPRFFVEL